VLGAAGLIRADDSALLADSVITSRQFGEFLAFNDDK
jgi:hypothetical protein